VVRKAIRLTNPATTHDIKNRAPTSFARPLILMIIGRARDSRVAFVSSAAAGSDEQAAQAGSDGSSASATSGVAGLARTIVSTTAAAERQPDRCHRQHLPPRSHSVVTLPRSEAPQ
jgi:hypothetical protein